MIERGNDILLPAGIDAPALVRTWYGQPICGVA